MAVTEGSLTQCVIEIRRALGDDAQQVVRTLPRRGFRFEAAVRAMPPLADGEVAREPSGPGPRSDAEAKPSSWRGSRRAAVLASVLLAAFAGVGWLAGSPMQGPVRAALGSRPSIAVLPFADHTERGGQQHLAEGLAAAVIDRLATSPTLRVTARASSFSFRDSHAPLAAIARALDTTHLLVGELERSGPTVRLSVRLFDAASGETAWRARYERSLADLLRAEREIAERVALEVAATLERGALAAPDAIAPEALEEFRIAEFLYHRRAPGDVDRALHSFERVVATEPRFARAWVGIAAIHALKLGEGELDERAGRMRQREAVQRALALDPDSPEAHVRAWHLMGAIGEMDAAREHMRRAQELGPNNPLVLAALGGYAADDGRLDEAVALLDRAVRLDPLNANYRGNREAYLLAAGRTQAAWETRGDLAALSPSRATPACELLVRLGRIADARAALADAQTEAGRAACEALVASADAREDGP